MGKSITTAYQRVITSCKSIRALINLASSGSSGSNTTFNQMKEQMGNMIKVPMTREEAIAILNIPPLAEAEGAGQHDPS